MKKIVLLMSVVALLFLSTACEKETVTPPAATPVDISAHLQPEQAFPGKTGIPRKGMLSGVPVDYMEIDGYGVFQGDIVLPLELFNGGTTENGKTEGTGRNNLGTRWVGGVVNFVLDPSLSTLQRQWATNAIAHWESRTHLRFQQRTTQADYIRISAGTGCFSTHVGRAGGEQHIQLGGCAVAGSAIHEIGHAIGLFHEQCRVDRNNTIIIHQQNIDPSPNALFQFQTYAQQGLDGFDHNTLDIGSIMMYGSFAFSANGLPTITRLDGSTFDGQRNGLSPGDIACAKFMYPADWTGTTAMTSLNGSLYMVQGAALVRADTQGNWQVLGTGDWSGTTAMTSLNGFLYVVQGGVLVRANPANGDWVVLGSGDWSGTTAMTAVSGYLYIVQGGVLVRADPSNGAWQVMGTGDWSGTTAMTSLNGYLYVVQGGYLVRSDTAGNWVVLGSGEWSGTTAMTQLNGSLYVVQGGALVRANPNNGDWQVLGSGNWSGTTAMTSLNGNLYIVQGSMLVQANPSNGSWVVLM